MDFRYRRNNLKFIVREDLSIYATGGNNLDKMMVKEDAKFLLCVFTLLAKITLVSCW